MAGGKTLAERIAERFRGKTPQEQQYNNPLNLRVGQQISVRWMDLDRILWTVDEMWAWEQHIAGKKHSFTDYALRSSDGQRCMLRLLPRANPTEEMPFHLLVMSQYYPDGDRPLAWCDESPAIIEACEDPTGEFYNHRGEENEEKYFRCGGKVPIPCTVKILRDENGDGKVEESEVTAANYTLWDYERETEIDGVKVNQYLYVQLDGKFKDGAITNGNKTLVMLRGEEIHPKNVMAY